MAVLATVGAVDTGVITLKRWGLMGSLACPGGAEGCDRVLSSPWGTVLGQPLSLFGFIAYALVLVMALLPVVMRFEGKSAPARRSWWGLFVVTTAMAVFSLLLMGLMVFAIPNYYDAPAGSIWCFFCVLSASLSLALMVLSLVGGDWEDRGALVFRGVLLALVVTLAGLGWATSLARPDVAVGPGAPPPVTSPSTPATVALAEHLSAEGAVMYSAYWCPHCHEQKELFGQEASKKLKVIECAADGQNSQKQLCDTKAIRGFPSWEIAGKIESGVKPLARLAELSGFKGGDQF